MPSMENKPPERTDPVPAGDEKPPDDGFGDLNGPSIDRDAEAKKIAEGGGDGSGEPPDDGFGDLNGPSTDRDAEAKKIAEAQPADTGDAAAAEQKKT
jgi:hypothetical protein